MLNMGAFCPNISMKSVRDGFNEIVEAFGGSPLTIEEFKNPELRNKRTGIDNMAMQKAYLVYDKNNGNTLDKDINGNPSELFNSLIVTTGSRNRAIVAKSVMYTDSYISKYGNPELTDNEMFTSLIEKLNVVGTDSSVEISSILGIENKEILNDHISKGTAINTSDNVLLKLLESGFIPKELLPIARVLLNVNVPIVITTPNNKTHLANTRNGSIELTTLGINTNIDVFISTLLHELVHITTVNTIENPKTKSDREFVNTLKSAFRKSISNYSKGNNQYGFSSLTEFASEFLSNPSFRKSLKQESLFDRVLNAILRLFKARSFNSDTFTSTDDLNLENALKTVIFENVQVNNYYKGVAYKVTDSDVQDNNLRKLVDNMVNGLKSRLSSVSRYKVPPQITIDAIKSIVETISIADTKIAIYEFVESHLTNISGIANEVVNKPISEITTKQLMQLSKDYVGFYLPIIQQIKYIIDTSDDLLDIQDYNSFVDHVNALYNEMEYLNNKVRDILIRKSRDFIIEYTNKYGGDAIQILDYLDNCDDDITWLSTYIGMNSSVDNDIVRIMENIIHNVKNNVSRETLIRGNKLKELLKAAQKKHGNAVTNIFQEKDKNGNTTGYFTRDRKYGEFYKDKRDFIKTLANKYKLSTDESGNVVFPDYTDANYTSFYNDYEDWMSSHSERRYTKEYYKLRNTLLPSSRIAMDDIRMQINTITSKHLNEDGVPELHKISSEDRAKIDVLNSQYSNLASPYYTNGIPKSGEDLIIANDIKRYRAELADNVKYKTNKALFNKAEARIISKYGKNSPEHNAWFNMNTEVVIDPEFWNLFTMSEKTDRYNELNEIKKSLLSQFKSKDSLGYNSDTASIEVLNAIKSIDELLEAEKTKGDKEFFTHANVYQTESYKKARKLAEEEAIAAGIELRETQWFKDNHYFSNANTFVPLSIHSYVRPKDSKYIVREPVRIWSELDKDSNYANKKFIENGESAQPSARYYDNSVEYNKIMNDPTLKNLYTELIDVMKESVEKISFLRNSDANKLPQISGRMMSILYRASNKKDALRYLFNDTFNIKDDDVDFVERFNARPDGTKIKNIPTRFIALLDDTSKITSDVVGSVVKFFEMAENYEQMSEQAPDLEMLSARLGDLEVKKNGVIIKNKGQLNAYKKSVKLLDMHVYGAKRDQLLVNGKNVTKLIDMVYNWTSKANLWYNIHSMATNLLSGAIYKLEESLLGRYFNKHDLAFAEMEFDKLFVKNVLSIGSKYKMNKVMSLLQLNQLTVSNDSVFDKLDQSPIIRALSTHWAWNGYSAGDFIVKSKIMLSIYHSYRLVTNNDGSKAFMTQQQYIDLNHPTDKKKGSTAFNTFKTTLYDAYNLKGLNADVKQEYSRYVDTDLLNAVQNKATTIATRIDGALSETDKTFIHANAFSRFLVQCKNFMIVGIQERFKPKQFNYNTGTEEIGYFRAVGGHLSDQSITLYKVMTSYFGNEKLASLKSLADNYNNLKDYEKYAVKKVMLDLLFITISSLITTMICSYVDGDDENKNNWFLQEVSYVSLRTAFELRTLYNPFELTGLMNSPSAAFNVITNASDVLKLIWIPNYFSEKGPFSTISSGRYEGMPKISKTLIRSTWAKNIYEAPDPKTIKNKRNYLENQLMW